jgi:hypothetical protein
MATVKTAPKDMTIEELKAARAELETEGKSARVLAAWDKRITDLEHQYMEVTTNGTSDSKPSKPTKAPKPAKPIKDSKPEPKATKDSTGSTKSPEISENGTPMVCLCGCGGATSKKSKFLQGHDAKLRSILVQISKGKLDDSAIPEVARPFLKDLNLMH